MKVELREMPEFRADLVRLLERRSRNRLDALAMAHVYLDDMKAVLKQFGGPPDDAEVRPRHPDGYWWLYVKGVWVGLSIRSTRKGVLGGLLRVITLAAVSRSPPATRPPGARGLRSPPRSGRPRAAGS